MPYTSVSTLPSDGNSFELVARGYERRRRRRRKLLPATYLVQPRHLLAALTLVCILPVRDLFVHVLTAQEREPRLYTAFRDHKGDRLIIRTKRQIRCPAGVAEGCDSLLHCHVVCVRSDDEACLCAAVAATAGKQFGWKLLSDPLFPRAPPRRQGFRADLVTIPTALHEKSADETLQLNVFTNDNRLNCPGAHACHPRATLWDALSPSTVDVGLSLTRAGPELSRSNQRPDEFAR